MSQQDQYPVSLVCGLRPTQLARLLQKHVSISNAYPQSAVLQNDIAGTGPASPLVDSSITVADQLFAPFSEELFSAELDIHALQKMLTQPLIAEVPVASDIFTQYCSLMPALYRSSDTEHAKWLLTWLDCALAQSWPSSGSYRNYIGFWDCLGFRLPDIAQRYCDCGVSCGR